MFAAASACCSAGAMVCSACTYARTCVNCCSGATCAGGTWKAGKVGSLMVMLNGVIMALIMQYGVGPKMRGIWLKGACSADGGGGYEHACLAEQGVFRIFFAVVSFFFLCAIGCRMARQFHDALWSVKVVVIYFPLILICLAAIPSDVIDGFVWVARVGAAMFVVLQMIFIVDLAYAVNDWFVAQSNAEYAALAAAHHDESFFAMLCNGGSMDEALCTLLGICAFLFAAALTGNILLFVYFSACATTTAFIAMTLVLCVGATLVQLIFAQNGNLLTSAAVSAYAVYVAYTAVSRNPDPVCNPFKEHKDIIGIVFGVSLSLISLGWTTHASTNAVAGLFNDGDDRDQELLPGGRKNDDDDDDDDDAETGAIRIPPPPIECLDGGDSVNVNFNLVLCLVACYIACSLTNWGTWRDTVANDISAPLGGVVAMWLNIASQWIFMLLYLWTLLAPLLFPDRDFS